MRRFRGRDRYETVSMPAPPTPQELTAAYDVGQAAWREAARRRAQSLVPGLTPIEGELEQALSKDQIDLSLTIRNSHLATLMEHDLTTWARIADRTEMHREMLKEKVKGLEYRLAQADAAFEAANYDWQDEIRAHRLTRYMALAALVIVFAFGVAGWLR